ncbi:hypothetical protein [Pelagibius sp. Alg239-R121]|uniref:hypothetical protein n=1 Tax=Pelagibius sp. Alg239-R121 TaxID=2993448 RepID=UPI0024A6FF82|nr:hypothetical protein [Pelagibius sp. Alg239-R121]
MGPLPKSGLFLIALVIALIGSTTASDPAHAQQDAKHKSRLLSAKMFAREAAQDAGGRYKAEQEAKTLRGEIKQQILSNIENHSTAEESEKLTLEFLDQRLEQEFDEALARAYRSVEIAESELSEEAFRRSMREAFTVQFEQSKKAFSDTAGALFVRARDEAVEAQMNRISLNHYPSIEQVEEMEKAGWPALDEKNFVKRTLVRKMQRAEPALLAEVSDAVERRIKQIIAHVKEQIAIQKTAIDSELAPELWTRGQISSSWTGSVQRAIDKQSESKEDWHYIYPLFSIVRIMIEEGAANLEKQRFDEFIEKHVLPLTDPGEIERLIRTDLIAHAEVETSRSLIVEKLFPRLQSLLVEAYVLGVPDQEQAEVRQRVKQSYLQELGDVLPARVNALIATPFEAARETIAAGQYRDNFRSIADRTWFFKPPDERFIVSMKLGDGTRIVDPVRIRDCLFIVCQDLGNLNLLNSISSVDFKTDVLLAETKEYVSRGVEDRINEALRAWDGQYEIYLGHTAAIKGVRSRDKNRLSTIKELIVGAPVGFDAKPPTAGSGSKKEWVTYFASLIEQIWSAYRVDTIWPQQPPASLDNRYALLFQEIRKQVEEKLNTDVETALSQIKNEKEAARLAEEARARETARLAEEARARETARLAEEARARETVRSESVTSQTSEPVGGLQGNSRDVPIGGSETGAGLGFWGSLWAYLAAFPLWVLALLLLALLLFVVLVATLIRTVSKARRGGKSLFGTSKNRTLSSAFLTGMKPQILMAILFVLLTVSVIINITIIIQLNAGAVSEGDYLSSEKIDDTGNFLYSAGDVNIIVEPPDREGDSPRVRIQRLR